MELKNGSGTPEDPYMIYGSTDFTDFVNNVNSGSTASASYKLGSDVSASDTDAITTAFTGTFDGGGFIITGLSHPLFNTIDGGVVKNVTLTNVSISSSADYVGAITGIAKGYSRIYNCGILPNDATFPKGIHPTVTGGTCAGGIVGKLDGDSRVINCYSYADVSASATAAGIVGQNTYASTAEVSGGQYSKLKTAVVNCMFYGNITGGNNQYGVYGGSLITNAAATGISSYNYYRSGSTFTTTSGNPTAYNCCFPAEERYLTQVEFHRSLLNSNRELCGWWVGSDVAPSTMTTAEVQAIPKDASLMYKWVVDPNVAPYPILKPFGKYASVINGNTGTPWVDRATANPYEGKQLGTLTVTVNSGSSASSKTLYIPITDMDTLRYDFGYRKIQLPYYNTVFGNPVADTWADKYAGNYTDKVVTGWKVTAVVTDGTVKTYNEFVPNWETGYNFADRKCINKDIYSTTNPRVFAQGGNYYVPDGVTEITIEAYWGDAFYVRNDGGFYDRVNITEANTGSAFAPAGTRETLGNGQTVYTTKIRDVIDNITQKKTVYDYAIVLVGNVQESNGNNAVTVSAGNTYGFTLMSADFDFDEEPDYCLEWQLGTKTTRNTIAPIRFDFLPVVELGIAGKLHNSRNFFSLGCFRSFGHFEVTETGFIRFGQFEFELPDRDEGPVILNGGIFDQYTRGRNDEKDQHINYVIVGGHVVMPSFTPGAHVGQKLQTRHCAVNALGGDFSSFYLTGGYNEGIEPFDDNPHCYIDGGRFGTIAAAYKEGIAGNVTWRINHALIGEFYGGGVMSQKDGTTYKIVKGSIDVVIDNCIVGKYCGGPKFGDMMDGKTVTTTATGTTFNQYFGAGNGGTNYVQYANTDNVESPISDWSSIINNNYHPGQYRNKAQGYEADYDYEVINTSAGTQANQVVDRSYYYSAQFATTNTGDVTSTLTDCTINTNFYGGGFLGGVTGNVTSTLNNCTVRGAVYGAGYSASAGTVSISNKDKVPPVANTYTGLIKPQSGGTSTTYYWTHDKGSTSSPITPATETDPKNYFYTEIPLDNLGTVSGNVTLTINGTTIVGESIYGGGEESVVNGNTIITITGGTIGTAGKGGAKWGNVYGGGKGKEKDVAAGLVKGNTNINISQASAEEPTTIYHNVYGGGAMGSVGTFTYDGTTGMPTALATANTGACTITITGGTIGSNGKENGMVFGSSRGDVATPEGEPAVDPNDRMAWVYSTHVTIGDAGAATSPTIKGSVYGSGENGHTFQNTTIDIKKGIIGITDTGTDGGAAYAYRGNVYGGGCGTDKYDSDGDDKKDAYNPLAGIVKGTTTINITGGQVVHNIYGAGAMGSVGGGAEANSGKTTINITGGRIGYDGDGNGHIFGAARGEYGVSTAASGLANVRETEVNINYTTTPTADNEGKTAELIAGTVFGGGEAGTVQESVAVNMTGGLILKDVYGGGALADTQTSNWDATANENAGDWADAEKKSTLHTTTVRLTGGRVGEEVFGGGLGEAGKPAYVWGDVLIDLNGTTTSGETGSAIDGDTKGCVVGQIFGCNNINGTPKGDVMVHVYATQTKDKDNISTKYDKNTKKFDVTAVYGGGNQAAYNPVTPYDGTSGSKTKVIIEGCLLTSINTVYGGGNAAAVPETNVEIKGAYEIGYLFGGGNGKDDIAPGVENPGADVGTPDHGASTYGTGNANTLMQGGLIHEAYGGSNTKGIIKGSINQITDPKDPADPEYCCDLEVEKIVGAGKYADVDGDVNMTLSCQPSKKVELLFAGADEANVNGNITLNITNGHFGKVFGGNNLGGAIKGKITVNVEETGCQPIKIDDLYLGSNEAAYSVFGYYESDEIHPVTGKKILKPRESADDSHDPVDNPATDETHTFPYKHPELNIISCTYIGNVFGGGFGEGAVMYANPTVNVNMKPGLYAETAVPAMMTELGLDVTKTAPNPDKLGIIRNVFGGGDAANIEGNTTVNIATEANKGAYIIGSVFGGGNAADVKGNTNVTMSGGYVFNGIFGGGYAGSVGTFTRSTAAADVNIYGHTTHEGCIGKPVSCAENTGKCTVVVDGGQIGPISVATEGMNRSKAEGGPVPEGWVWGAGQGLVEDPATHPDTHFTAYVNETDVTIKDGAFVLESIIGGGEFGRVLGNTKVKIEGGQIGVGANQTEEGKPKRYSDDKFVDPSKITITDDNALAPCSHYPYGKEVGGVTVYETYDPYADEYKEVHGALPEGLEGGSTAAPSDGKTWIGCVFGGGSGYFPYKTTDAEGNITGYGWVESAGWVEGDAEVTISGGHILSNVYGANEYTTVQGKSTVTMTGGTIGVPRTQAQIGVDPKIGHLFGGGKGDPRPYFKNKTNAGNVEIDISGGIIYGSVFGGGESGTVKGGVTVTMTGGSVLSDVYGGGALADTQTNNWDASANDGAGDWAAGKTSASATTTVRLTGGDILGEAYGGGLGETGSPAYVYGDVLLDLNGTTTSGEEGTAIAATERGCAVNQVFGCNNAAGTPMGDVLVHVYATQNKTKSQIGNTDGETPVTDAKVKGSYDVTAVYGGGNLAAYEPAGGKETTNSTNVIIDGCELTSIQTVYGGGNAASTPATNVEINGTYEILELFGGGNGFDRLPDGRPNPGANVGYKNYTIYEKVGDEWVAKDDPAYDTKEERTAPGSAIVYGTGQASVNIFGGTVHRVFGGSNTKGNVRQTAVTLLDENSGCDFCVDEAYGGGKSAPMDAEAKLLMACIPGLKAAYGGAEAAAIKGNVTLNITNGTFDRVFGGNNLSGTIDGSITVNIQEVSCRPIIIGELYGGGNQAGYSVYGYNDDGTPKESGTKLYDDPQVNVMSFTSIGKVFGGGYGSSATMVGNPTVNVNEVYGRYYNDDRSIVGEDAKTGDYPIPSHAKGKMGAIHTVFGGGNAAKVIGNATVNIANLSEVYVVKQVTAGEALPEGCYTRSGAGTTADPFVYTPATGTASADVTYYEKKAVLGVDIRDNVYGGGNNAEVTGDANVNIGKRSE